MLHRLINDGDCIQLGIGGIPDAAALALKNKHDLGVHSEMITNSMVELVEAGVITGRKKNFMPGKMVGTFAYGTQKLYDMLEENPGVRMLRGETVNNPQIVAQNDNFVSINACVGGSHRTRCARVHWFPAVFRFRRSGGYGSGCGALQKWPEYHCYGLYQARGDCVHHYSSAGARQHCHP